MEVRVLRGRHEIGGTCIEIRSNKKTLLLDIGSPLSDKNPDISYVKDKYNAVLISHSHADHYGLMNKLDPGIPIYMGELTYQLIHALEYFANQPLPANPIFQFKPWEWIVIEGTPFKVYPYLMDHSSPEAFAFVISDGEEQIFYTGDFRATGAKQKVFDRLEQNPPKQIKKLIIEGTNINRTPGKYRTEEDVQNAFLDIFRVQKNISFVIGSSQNVDRIIRAYNAAMKAKKTLVTDFYTYWILTLTAKESTAIRVALNNIKVLRKGNISGGQYSKMMKHLDVFDEFARRIFKEKRSLTEEDLLENPANYVFYGRMTHYSLIGKFECTNLNLIYSQYTGYLSDKFAGKVFGAVQINELRKEVNFKEIHTSGHANEEDLLRMESLFPDAELIRVHTEF